MRINIDLDEKLVIKGLKATKLPTVKALINYALEEMVRRSERCGLLPLMDSHCWRGSLRQMRSSHSNRK